MINWLTWSTDWHDQLKGLTELKPHSQGQFSYSPFCVCLFVYRVLCFPSVCLWTICKINAKCVPSMGSRGHQAVTVIPKGLRSWDRAQTICVEVCQFLDVGRWSPPGARLSSAIDYHHPLHMTLAVAEALRPNTLTNLAKVFVSFWAVMLLTLCHPRWHPEDRRHEDVHATFPGAHQRSPDQS